MKDVMLDFETFGNGENKCLSQVGAVYFDSSTGLLGEEFFMNIDAESHVKRGGIIDASTVYWWLAQSDEARKSILADPRIDVVEAMTALNDFLAPAARIWSHATFDFVTLTETLRKLGIKPKFSYRAGLDLRTLSYLAGITVDKTAREGVHHNGLDDAKHQVKYAVEALKSIKTNKAVVKFINRIID
jgi:hypothetical protein